MNEVGSTGGTGDGEEARCSMSYPASEFTGKVKQTLRFGISESRDQSASFSVAYCYCFADCRCWS